MKTESNEQEKLFGLCNEKENYANLSKSLLRIENREFSMSFRWKSLLISLNVIRIILFQITVRKHIPMVFD